MEHTFVGRREEWPAAGREAKRNPSFRLPVFLHGAVECRAMVVPLSIVHWSAHTQWKVSILSQRRSVICLWQAQDGRESRDSVFLLMVFAGEPCATAVLTSHPSSSASGDAGSGGDPFNHSLLCYTLSPLCAIRSSSSSLSSKGQMIVG